MYGSIRTIPQDIFELQDRANVGLPAMKATYMLFEMYDHVSIWHASKANKSKPTIAFKYFHVCEGRVPHVAYMSWLISLNEQRTSTPQIVAKHPLPYSRAGCGNYSTSFPFRTKTRPHADTQWTRGTERYQKSSSLQTPHSDLFLSLSLFVSLSLSPSPSPVSLCLSKSFLSF